MRVPDRKNRKKRKSLKICLLTYRGNPTCGGQGVYISYISKALRQLGHHVDVISGPPYPVLRDGVKLRKLPGLDLYNQDHMFRPARYSDLVHPINLFEFVSMCCGGFPEPFTFGHRIHHYFRTQKPDYDVVHDNQCLSYGLLGLKRCGYPIVATIHHPITVDRNLEWEASKSVMKKLKVWRWYSFLPMQGRVSRKLSRIITVSECSKKDIAREFNIPLENFKVVPNGINTDYFYPLKKIHREDNHLIVTNSADTPLKGLHYLLDAVDSMRKTHKIKLTVIGEPKKNGAIDNMVRDLQLTECVHFTGRIEYEEFAGYYARASVAVIPSIYEGFGMPAGEAMACGIPVISTTGGALPEVVGDAGILVPPGDARALEQAIVSLLGDRDKREKLGEAGLRRVKGAFTWRHAADKIIDIYHEAIDANGRL